MLSCGQRIDHSAWTDYHTEHHKLHLQDSQNCVKILTQDNTIEMYISATEVFTKLYKYDLDLKILKTFHQFISQLQ